MAEFVLKSGASLTVSMAAFEVGNSLRKAVMRAAKGEEGLLNEATLMALLADDEIERQFFLCAQAAIYSGAKVNKALFDDPALGAQARGDYFEIFSKVLEVNLNPFFLRVSVSSKPSTTKE